MFSHLVGDTITKTQGGLARCYDALVFEIQVLMCSPSLGTGIDITFPDPQCLEESGLCKVDCVFGFFYPKVNTHTDMDQQLWRVRNPGQVKVARIKK